MKQFNAQMRKQLVLIYEVSLACNLRCSYCSVLHRLDQKKNNNPELDQVVVQRLKDFTEENPDWQVEIQIVGGDPLTKPDIFEFLDKLLVLNIKVRVITNLIPTDDTKIDKLVEYFKKHDNIAITASWHADIGAKQDEKYKRNFLRLLEVSKPIYNVSGGVTVPNIVSTAVLFNEHEGMVEKNAWLREHNIVHTMSLLHDGGERQTYYSDLKPEYKKIFSESAINYSKYFVDDMEIPAPEIERDDWHLMANKYYIVCEPINYYLRYNGEVSPSCTTTNKKFKYNIFDEPIKVPKMFCPSGDCSCNINCYKEIGIEKGKIEK